MYIFLLLVYYILISNLLVVEHIMFTLIISKVFINDILNKSLFFVG